MKNSPYKIIQSQTSFSSIVISVCVGWGEGGGVNDRIDQVWKYPPTPRIDPPHLLSKFAGNARKKQRRSVIGSYALFFVRVQSKNIKIILFEFRCKIQLAKNIFI